MDTDVQVHHGVNSFSVVGDGRNIQGLVEAASNESLLYGRPIERIEVADASVEGHVEISFVFVAQTDEQRAVEQLEVAGS